MDLLSGWNSLWGAIGGGGLTVALTVVGAALIVFSIVAWVIKKRGGGGGSAMAGFPWWPVIGGAILCGPVVTIPLVLGILQAVINIGIALFTMFVGLF
ncbi:hypothetical protein ACXR2T_10270 [Leucobacter sp. HY1910]